GFFESIKYYQQAIDKDPSYALAYAGLSQSYAPLATFAMFPPDDMMPKSEAAARKALDIDPNLSEAYTGLALATTYYDRNWPEAEKYFKQALSLNPTYPTAHQWYSLYLNAVGRSDEAVGEAKRALDLDPLSLPISYQVASAYYLSRHYDEAIEQGRKGVEMDSNFPLSHRGLARAYSAKGLYPEAIAEWKKYQDLNPGSDALANLIHCYGRAGDQRQARHALEMLRGRSREGYVPAYAFAIAHVGLGEKDQALISLEQAITNRESVVVFLKVDAIWDPIRSDARFADLVRSIGLSQ